MKLIVLVVLIFGSVVLAHADMSNCMGSNLQDGGMVYGTCTNGQFSGYETPTGESVYGTCSEGRFSGYTSLGAMVSGTCSGDTGQEEDI